MRIFSVCCTEKRLLCLLNRYRPGRVAESCRIAACRVPVFKPPLAKGVGGFAGRMKSPCIPLFKRGKSPHATSWQSQNQLLKTCQGAQVRRNEAYFLSAAMTEDAAQHSKWAFLNSLLKNERWRFRRQYQGSSFGSASCSDTNDEGGRICI